MIRRLLKEFWVGPGFPLFALVLGVSAILALGASRFVTTGDIVYVGITVAALLLLALGLFGVRKQFAHVIRNRHYDGK